MFQCIWAGIVGISLHYHNYETCQRGDNGSVVLLEQKSPHLGTHQTQKMVSMQKRGALGETRDMRGLEGDCGFRFLVCWGYIGGNIGRMERQ